MNVLKTKIILHKLDSIESINSNLEIILKSNIYKEPHSNLVTLLFDFPLEALMLNNLTYICMLNSKIRLEIVSRFLAVLYALLLIMLLVFITNCASGDPTKITHRFTKQIVPEGDITLLAPTESEPELQGLTTIEAQQQNVNGVSIQKGGYSPEFKGGEAALSLFIYDTMKYPHEAKVKNVEGTVFLSFIINEKGEIENPKVVKGIPELNEEALRIVNVMPNWIPGTMDGKAEPVEFSMSIVFRLPKAEWVDRRQITHDA